MDLKTRSEIKQQVVNETGYKTAVRKDVTEQKVLNKDLFCECFTEPNHRSLDCLNKHALKRLFVYENEKYEICEWREGIELHNIKNEGDIKYVYGVNIETSNKISALDGRVFDIDELFALLTIMFDNNNMDYLKAREDWFLGQNVKFHNIECLVSNKYDQNHYRLVAISGTLEQLQKDKSFSEYHEWGAVALPIVCRECKVTFWFDDRDVPRGEKYECTCPECNFNFLLKSKSKN